MSRRIIIDELEFEVPYGKLAAKTWHEETDESKRVLLLHGWMDNAGVFDYMAPHLKHKDGLYLVAIDLPGHGKSSQLPPGSSYSDLNMVMEIRRVLIELGWVQSIAKDDSNSNGSPRVNQRPFTIIGHSLGGGLGTFYASLFPHDVDNLVFLDFLKALTYPTDQFLDKTAMTIDQFIDIVPSRSPDGSPTMTRANQSNNSSKMIDKGRVAISQETAVVATIEAHKSFGDLSRDDALCILRRSTVAVSTPPNGVLYSRDLRMMSMLNMREHAEYQRVMFGRCLGNILMILGKRGIYSPDGCHELGAHFIDHLDDFRKLYEKRAKCVHVQWIDADHFLLMSKAKEVCEMINRFFESPSDFKTVG